MTESPLGQFDELTLHLKSTIQALIIRAERAERERDEARAEIERMRTVVIKVEGKIDAAVANVFARMVRDGIIDIQE